MSPLGQFDLRCFEPAGLLHRAEKPRRDLGIVALLPWAKLKVRARVGKNDANVLLWDNTDVRNRLYRISVDHHSLL